MRPTLRKVLTVPLVWVGALLLFWLALREVNFVEVWGILQSMRVSDIGILLFINGMIFTLFCLRWAMFLHAQGSPVSLPALVKYRLTSFGITYFTPGPQFGGEPYQVYALHKKHQVPLSRAVSTVALDKLVELLGNFSFLVFGLITVFYLGLFSEVSSLPALVLSLILLSLPVGYFIALWVGSNPVAWMTSFLARRAPQWAWLRGLKKSLDTAEIEIARFCRERPGLFAATMLLAGVTWLAVIAEFFLMARFLGLPLSVPQAVGVLTAARIAFLLPMPSGLGALEASQVFAMQALGLNPAMGVSLSLLIRLRDVFFAGTGLWLGGLALRSIRVHYMEGRSGEFEYGEL